MAKQKSKKKKGKKVKKIQKRKRVISGLLISAFILLAGGLLYVNHNFNKLIAEKITDLYQQSEAANYYSLKFEKLRVNLLSQKIKVYNLHFTPNYKSKKAFFDKNGSVEVFVGKIIIKNASILDFLSDNNLQISEYNIKDSKISIHKPTNKFQPFAFIKKEQKEDSLNIIINIQHLYVQKAELRYYSGNDKQTENHFKDFDMEVHQVYYSKSKSFEFSVKKLMASIGGISYSSKEGAHISMKQFQIGFADFKSQNTNSTFDFNFNDLYFQVKEPRLISSDSLYEVRAQILRIDKNKQELIIQQSKVSPLLNKEQFVQYFKYQQLRPDVSIERIKMTHIDFDRIMNNTGLFSDSLIIQGVKANLFKSKLKPINKNKIPHYLALQIKSIKYPLNVKVVKATDVEIDFRLQQENGSMSRVRINKLQGTLRNVQNHSSTKKLYLDAKGKLENSIPFSASLVFNYSLDRYTYKASVYKSNLRNISKMVRSFAAVEIKSGIINKMTFSGVVNRTDSRGKMTFLYNNLNIQLQNKETSNNNRFGKSVLSFAANTYLLSNNPTKSELPPRKVEFIVGRDMNKGFIHILIQSILSGIKETLIPSRENRQRYKQEKKKSKQ